MGVCVQRLSRLCVGRGTGHPSGCRAGGGGCWLVVRSPPSISSLPDPFFLDCLSQACRPAPRSFPPQSLLQRCFGSAAGQWFRSRLVCHVYRSFYRPTLSPGSLVTQTPRVSVSAGPFGAVRNHNPTRTAIIFVCVDSFNRLLTAKHRMLNPSLIPRSHAHDTTHSSGHGLSS